MAGKPLRCRVCGKTFEAKDHVLRIGVGRVKEEGFSERKEWGLVHEICFIHAVDMPKVAMEEIRKIARDSESKIAAAPRK